ncbi:MAG: TolC family protein [Candidatus Cloacimonetes bacterium]|nr:TolC family protein [Candidatus Cloacimonadota bacterium]
MKKLKTTLLFIFGLISLPSLLFSQTINLNEFLNQLQQTHPFFEKEKLTAQIEKEEQDSYLGAQDWNIISSTNFAHEEPAFAFMEPERTNSFSLTCGIERLFWRTGGRLSSSFSTNYANINPNYGYPDPFYQNQISITYIHPLLKNRNGFLDRLQYDLKQYDIDFSRVQALENLENFLTQSSEKFLGWVLQTELKKIVSDRLELSEEELARTRKKREANLVDQVDVIRAEDAVLISKQNLMLITSQWEAVQAELAVISQNNELYNLSPEYNLYELKEIIPLDKAISHLKENSRLIRIIDIRLKQLEFSRKGYAEDIKPDLSLVTAINIKNLNEKFGSSLIMDKPDAMVGLQYSFPLEKRTARSKIIKTNLKIRQLKEQLDDLTLNLVSALTNLHIQIKNLDKVLKLNQEQIESAKERTEEELKLYNQGRGDLTFVIMSRDNEQNAKLTYAQNSLMYHKLMLQYKALMDQIYE